MKISALQLPTESFLKDFIIILNNSEKDKYMIKDSPEAVLAFLYFDIF